MLVITATEGVDHVHRVQTPTQTHFQNNNIGCSGPENKQSSQSGELEVSERNRTSGLINRTTKHRQFLYPKHRHRQHESVSLKRSKWGEVNVPVRYPASLNRASKTATVDPFPLVPPTVTTACATGNSLKPVGHRRQPAPVPAPLPWGEWSQSAAATAQATPYSSPAATTTGRIVTLLRLVEYLHLPPGPGDARSILTTTAR